MYSVTAVELGIQTTRIYARSNRYHVANYISLAIYIIIQLIIITNWFCNFETLSRKAMNYI